jgi:hypothetical protein
VGPSRGLVLNPNGTHGQNVEKMWGDLSKMKSQNIIKDIIWIINKLKM